MNNMQNQVQLIGHLGMDVEHKKFDNSKQLARITIATNETYKNSAGERVTDTQWHNCIAWGTTANLLSKYAKKGDRVVIQGKIINKTFTGKDGVKRYQTEIQISDFLLINNKK